MAINLQNNPKDLKKLKQTTISTAAIIYEHKHR